MNRTDLIASLARQLGFETIETRNMDSLDFRDVGVASLRSALEAAYEAGRQAERAKPARKVSR